MNATRLWVWALSAAVLMQTLAAFLTRVFPVIGPALTDAVGVPSEYIGYLAALNSVGTMWYLVAAGEFLPRLGPLRAMQVGTLVGVAGTLVTLSGTWWALVVASVLIGFGYGPTPTAGSEVLMQYAPVRHRSLVFSIKQSGVPLGGAVAGLLVPWLLAVGGWRAACIGSALLVLGLTIVVQPLRAPIDRMRDAERAFHLVRLFDPRVLASPFSALERDPALLLCTASSVCFAIVQGSLLAFFVTYVTIRIELSLAIAGMAFSLMQVTGVGGRVLAGWLADRLRSARVVLIGLGGASALTLAALATITPASPVWAIYVIAAVSGVACTSWNGVFMAQLSALSAPGHVGEVAAAATFFTFVGYVAGPAAFGWALNSGTSYPLAFAALAVIPIAGVGAVALVRARPARAA